MNGDNSQGGGAAPASPASKRKPVPTPRSTLRKPALDKEEQLRKKLIINGIDSQGQTSGESGSPDDTQHNGKNGGEVGEDIIAALEMIPGVGSLRSLNSMGSSQPSYTLDQRFRREESSHSISSGLSLGISSDRKRSLGERSHTSPRILLLNGKHKENLAKDERSDETDATSLSTSPEGAAGACGLNKVQRGTEKRRSLKSVKILESDNEMQGPNEHEQQPKIQTRPLPQIPPVSKDNNVKKDDDAIEVVSSLSEEIYTALLTPEDHYQELKPTIPVAMKKKTENHTSENCFNETIDSKKLTCESMASLPVSVGNSSKNYLTLAGTIKRGKLPQKSLDIQLSVTPDHLSKLEKRVHDKYHDRCFCGLRRGPHVFLISLLSIPFMLVYSLFQAFFLGSMTWYNIFLHYNEDRSCCHKLLSPFVLLFYPLWIVPVTIGLALYGLVRPISWYWDSWLSEIRNPDGGFMAWACTQMNLADCAPYQVVLLSAEESPHHATKIHQGCHTIEKV